MCVHKAVSVICEKKVDNKNIIRCTIKQHAASFPDSFSNIYDMRFELSYL